MIGVASQIANTPRFSEFLTHIEKDGQSNENQNFKKKETGIYVQWKMESEPVQIIA